MADATINPGGTFNYTVVAKNANGDVVAVSDAAVALSPDNLGSNSVNPDGSNGVYSAGSTPGIVIMTPSAGGVTGTPFQLQIFDNVVASVTIVPSAVASVAIQPK